MLITYFDEVKYEPPLQTGYWFGGICVDVASIPILEGQMDDLAREFFPEHGPEIESEFHAKDISSGKGPFKGIEPEERFGLLKRLAHIVDQEKLLKRVYVKLMPENLVAYKRDHHQLALMFFLEQVDKLYGRLNAKGLVIGDYDNNQSVSKSVRSLASYKAHKTEFDMGRKIVNILDTVHFARSHHSRMLQIADCYLWFCQLMAQDRDSKSYYLSDLMEYIDQKTSATYADGSKDWPLSKDWQPSH